MEPLISDSENELNYIRHSQLISQGSANSPLQQLINCQIICLMFKCSVGGQIAFSSILHLQCSVLANRRKVGGKERRETHFHNWTYPCKSSLALQKYTQRIFLMLKKNISVSFLRHSHHKGNHYGDF